MENKRNVQDSHLQLQRMELLGHLTSGLIHEIRNPLAGIHILLDGVKEYIKYSENPNMIELISEAQEAADKIELLIKRIVDFSKDSSQQLLISNINQSILNAVDLIATSLRKLNIELKIDLDDALPPVAICYPLLEQLLLNLIMNAYEALQDVALRKIYIVSERQLRWLLIRVDDSGPGIAQELRQQIFAPCYSTKSHHLGLGLAICRKIASQHGGHIEVADSQLGGAQFTLKIPANSEDSCD